MQKQRILLITVTGTVVVLLSLLYFLYNPSHQMFFPKCIFYTLTHLYCPGCGAQRAVHALLHGHLKMAAHYNLLLVIFIPLAVYTAFAFVWNTFFEPKIRLTLLYKPLFAQLVLIGVISFWICRNLPFAPFLWLAP